MWLLDTNLDIRICQLLGEFGIDGQTAESCGWREMVNGQLVSVAVAAGFTCVLTRDQLFAESASRALKQFPQFAVVLVGLKQRRRAEYLAQFRLALERERIVPIPGRTITWPAADDLI